MKNSKGFMLAEVIITSTVIITALIGLYTTFNKIYNKYNIRNSYYDIDGVYAIKGMINHLIKDNKLNNILSDKDTGTFTSNQIYLIKDRICNSFINSENTGTISLSNDNYCKSLQELYKINNLIVIDYDKKLLIDESNNNDLKDSVNNQTFKDYIEYISNYYTFEKDKYSYLFIIEYKNDKNEFNYSSLEVR